MTFSGDPFRALGLPAGASEAEIRRAYRALAKRFHPDSAGEAALPRFLAIQAAYDMLMTPNGRLRGRAPGPSRDPAAGGGPVRPPGPAGSTNPRGTGGPGGPTPAGGPSAGSRADPDRTRATRDSFRARRTGPAGTTGPRPTGGPAWWAAGRSGTAGAGTRPAGQGRDDGVGPDGTDGAGPESAGPSGSARAGTAPGTGGARRPAGGPDARRSRAHRSATLGSTSYDDAPKEPEPEWNGATWYGDSSGTYWTVNPKEYADPRKHGPEYLARARRGAAGIPPDPAAAAAGPWNGEDPVSAAPGDPPWPGTQPPAGAAGGRGPDPEPLRPAPPGAASGRPPRATRAAAFESRRERAAAWTSGSTGSTGTAWTGATARVAFDPGPPNDRDDDALAEPFQPAIPQRIVLALIAWPPLGLAAWAAIGELTGCGRAAATCSEPSSALGWLVQPVILALLLLLPAVARPAAVASVAVGIAAVGGAALLSALGGARAQASPAPTLLVAIIVMAYAVGLIGALSGKVPLPSWLNRSD